MAVEMGEGSFLPITPAIIEAFGVAPVGDLPPRSPVIDRDWLSRYKTECYPVEGTKVTSIAFMGSDFGP